ncbi:MAG: hypothetical protein ABIQ56_04225 [Chitinophagaceae bacterium]
MHLPSIGQPAYIVNFLIVDKDSSLKTESPDLHSVFANRIEAVTYINKLPVMLFSKGFATASVDSVSLDSVSATVQLYLGKKYSFAGINVN